jgi:serine/threonine protein kinase
MDTKDTGDRHPFEKIADEFVLQLRSGHTPSIDHYAEKHPEHASMIRSVFPSLQIVERVSAKDATASLASTEPAQSPRAEGQLGYLPAYSHFDDFKILRWIGHGGMGVVYEAIQESLHRKVALKVIHAQAAASQQSKDRFRREAQSAAGLHHTNIVPVYGSGQDHGLLYYAMQLIHGSTLAQIIESLQRRSKGVLQSQLPIDQQTHDALDQLLQERTSGSSAEPKASTSYVKENLGEDSDRTLASATRELTIGHHNEPTRGGSWTTKQESQTPEPTSAQQPGAKLPKHYFRNISRLVSHVASALDYAHQSGVLHRDIKPSNLLLDDSGTIWVADFGLARREDLDGQTQTGELLGTLRYMAPEQFAGKSDPRSDIYSLGLTLFELLTLRPAMDSPKRRLLDPTLYSQVEFTSYEKQSIPVDLQTIVLKAAAIEPEKRYPRAKLLQEDLERFLDDQPILARRETWIESGIRWARRNRAIATLAASLFGLLFAIAILLGLWNAQQSKTLEELRQANAFSAKTLHERTEALGRAEIEAKRAKQNMDLALEAFDTITQNISSRGRSLEILELDNENVDSIGFADAVLTQADVQLLNSLQDFFDRFAQENSADLRLDAAIARRRVGEIEHKIGRHDQATNSLSNAIKEFASIRANKDNLGDLKKVLNEELKARKELIGLHARRDQVPKAQEEMQKLRELLKEHPEFADSPEGRLALASALSSLCSGGARLALERSLNERRRRNFPPFFNRPAGNPIDLAPPMVLRIQRDLSYNTEAIELLEKLCQEDPSQSQYRLDLARNHRDRMRLSRLLGNQADFETSLSKATEIFQQLLEKNPKSPVLKYELANLYASGLMVPSDDGKRLELAIGMMREVIEEHPSVPEYQALYASLLARVAWSMPFAQEASTERQFERVENGIAKFQQAISIQQGLVDRFPDIPLYGINLLQIKVQLVEFTSQFRRPEKAKQYLAEAMALAEKMLESGAARQPVVRSILERLKDRKTALENRPDPEKP